MSRCSSTPLAIVIAPILICVLASVVLALEFGYAESYGPDQWGECSGRHHSPLTIDLVNAVEKNFTELEIINFNVVPRTFEMSNNGHTVLVKMSFNKETVPTVKGGPLAEKTPLGYQFEQFHFYWGDNETFANKDVAINQAYLFELHLVLRNSEYPNLTIAMEKDHGIAVMAFYFHIGLVPARGYTDFTDLLAQIDRKGQTVNMNYPLPLGEYISKYLDNYFSYSDSLTIPPCSVEATWLYFPYTIDITEEQFNVFHRLTASDDHLKNDFPPSEPLNVGTLYKNKETRNDSYSVPLVNVANVAERWKPHLMGALLYICVLVPLLRTSDFSGF